MANAKTLAGSKFYIAVDGTGDALPQNSDLTQSQFDGLDWLEVKGVGSLGQTGVSTNIVTYDDYDTEVTQKGKGISNAGDPEVECRRIGSDPGQVEMRKAALDQTNSYAFKHELADKATSSGNGTTYYNRGLVTGPMTPNGRNEDFDLEMFTLGLNQRQIVKEAS